MSMLGCLTGGANLVLHAAGWQEGGLTASFEKFVLDVEMLQMLAESLQPIVVDDAELAIEAIDDVGPGGHFFGTAHTLARFETAFYEPEVFTRQNFGQWTDAGSLDAGAAGDRGVAALARRVRGTTARRRRARRHRRPRRPSRRRRRHPARIVTTGNVAP